MNRVLEAINWTEGLEEVWKENREEDPDLAWQYFGSSTGFMRMYPGELNKTMLKLIFE